MYWGVWTVASSGEEEVTLTFSALAVCVQKLLEDLEEASNELMVSDEDTVRYVTGDCFVSCAPDAAETRLQKDTHTAGAEVERLTVELASIKGEMDALKTVLYARFGNNINLEDE